MRHTLLLAGMALLSSFAAADDGDWSPANRSYYREVMSAPPLLPARLDQALETCPVGSVGISGTEYRGVGAVGYDQPGWERRVAADWTFFDVSPTLGRVLVIDSRMQDGQPAFRYLANGTQNQLYEPWSSSKFMAFSAAIATARQKGIGADAMVGEVHVADLITSINSYAPHGAADGDSNAIATWFLNVAGRDAATALFHERWLRLANPAVRIRGAYDVNVFDPGTTTWTSNDGRIRADIDPYPASTDDPGYQAYRCETCGRTGNKPMTTLAQAEWLKRLATHDTAPSTRHPGLLSEDVRILFEGRPDGPDRPVGGMRAGISRMLSHALAVTIAGLSDSPGSQADLGAKAVLDQATDGRWSLWQKIGWGPSETRDTAENVVLAQVCLPGFQGGRAFTIAAHAGVTGATGEHVSLAGQRMEQLLTRTLRQLLTPVAGSE